MRGTRADQDHISPESGDGRATVQSVGRALDIFEQVVTARQELGLRDLSEATGIPVGTAHRLVSVLVQRGFLTQNPATRRYTIGQRAIVLARSIVASGDIAQQTEPYLRELVDLTGESANLAALGGAEAVYLAHVAPARTVRMFTEVGRRAPLYATGTGKVLLAFLTPAQCETALANRPLRQFTSNTITTRDALAAELQTIRKQGFAHDNGEYEDGVRCIAAPVRNAAGRVIAAVSVSGPDGRFTRERVDGWLPQILDVVSRLSAALNT